MADDVSLLSSNSLAAGVSKLIWGQCYPLSRGSGGNDTLLCIALFRTTLVVSMIISVF